MKYINFCLIIISCNFLYSMQRIPYLATSNVAAQAAKLTKYTPKDTKNFSSMTLPQVRLSKEEIQTLSQDIAQDLEYSQVKPWKKLKVPTEFRASTGGMFKSTRPLLMRWNYLESPYDVLGVTTGATETEIKTAHKKMAMKHHPDRGGKPEDFRKVQEAYEYLKYLSQKGQKYSKTQEQKQDYSKNQEQKQDYSKSYTNIKKNYISPKNAFLFLSITLFIIIIEESLNGIYLSLDTESSDPDILNTLLILRQDLNEIKSEEENLSSEDSYSLFINKIQKCINMIWSLIIRIKEFLYSLKDKLIFNKNLENIAININKTEKKIENIEPINSYLEEDELIFDIEHPVFNF